ncbi:MAG: hypothetical protein K2Q18_19445 [Bdellovibrionales bacterium]|nr:hypothetical protein [Bdellovibrionales bacterium]
MKSYLTSLIIALTITFNTGLAYEVPKECTTMKVVPSTNCVSCAEGFATKISEGPSVLSNDLLRSLQEFTIFDEKVSSLSQVHTSLKLSLAPLLRTLRDGKKEPSFKESMVEINSIKGDFDRLTLLSKELVVTRKKFDICLNQCSAYRKLELQDTILEIQKAKVALLIKRPILANQVFEEMMLNIPQHLIDNELPFREIEFHASLLTALSTTLRALIDKEKDIASFQYDGSRPIIRVGNEEYTSEYVLGMAERFPELVEDVLKYSESDGTFANLKNGNNTLCNYAKKFAEYSKKKEYQKTAIDIGLFVLPMLAGPFGIEGALALRLSTWGIRATEFSKVIKTGSILINVGNLAKDNLDLKSLLEKCSRDEIRFYKNRNTNSLKEFQACQEEYGEQLFISQLGVLATGISGLSKFALNAIELNKASRVSTSVARDVKSSQEISSYVKSNGLKELKPGQVGLEFTTPDQGTFSIFNLNEVMKSGSENVKKLPESYWRYVANIYSDRLNLSKEEIENFIKTSVEMSSRTKLIMNTGKSPLEKGVLNIKGGVGIVDSKVVGELLPFEKATGIRILRKPNEKIAEIVRLSVGKESDVVKLSSSLIDQALNLIQSDKNINRIFIYTSKAHARLYKSFGVTTENIRPLDKRDVLIEITREQLKKFIDGKGPLTSDKVSGRHFFPSALENYLARA